MQNALSTLHSLLTLETMSYSYLSCCYFSRQKFSLSSTKVKISCLHKNFPHCIFITVAYRLQKFVPKLFLSFTHFTRKQPRRFFAMNANKSTFPQLQTFITKREVGAVNWWRVLSSKILRSPVFVRLIQNAGRRRCGHVCVVWYTVTELPVHQICARTNS